jgi:hypothetical protein
MLSKCRAHTNFKKRKAISCHTCIYSAATSMTNTIADKGCLNFIDLYMACKTGHAVEGKALFLSLICKLDVPKYV